MSAPPHRDLRSSACLPIVLFAAYRHGSPQLRRHLGAYVLLTAFNVGGFLAFQTQAINALPSAWAAS